MDKHKLYRAIKQARGQQEQQLCAGMGQYELSGNSGGDLLDLDAHDGDLIEVSRTSSMHPWAVAAPTATAPISSPGPQSGVFVWLTYAHTVLKIMLVSFAGSVPYVPGVTATR